MIRFSECAAQRRPLMNGSVPIFHKMTALDTFSWYCMMYWLEIVPTPTQMHNQNSQFLRIILTCTSRLTRRTTTAGQFYSSTGLDWKLCGGAAVQLPAVFQQGQYRRHLSNLPNFPPLPDLNKGRFTGHCCQAVSLAVQNELVAEAAVDLLSSKSM